MIVEQAHAEAFLATRFGGDVSDVELGEAAGGYYAISERVFGEAYADHWANLHDTARRTLQIAR